MIMRSQGLISLRSNDYGGIFLSRIARTIMAAAKMHPAIFNPGSRYGKRRPEGRLFLYDAVSGCAGTCAFAEKVSSQDEREYMPRQPRYLLE